jgi:hypothetical protein
LRTNIKNIKKILPFLLVFCSLIPLAASPLASAVVYGVEYWTYSYSGMYNAIGGRPDMAFYPVIKDGFSVIELNHSISYIEQYNPTVTDREINGMFTTIQAGDIIDFKATIKTEASSFSDTYIYAGGNIGIDLYVANGRLAEINTPDGTPTYPTYPSTRIFVAPNSDWTFKEISFTVQPTYLGDTWGVLPDQNAVPIGFIAFISWGSSAPANETAKMWIKDVSLSVNGETINILNPTPQPVAQPIEVTNIAPTLTVFLIGCAVLVLTAIVAFLIYPLIGIITGIAGLGFTAYVFNSGVIFIDSTHYIMIGWLVFVPIALSVFNFTVPLLGKKGKA